MSFMYPRICEIRRSRDVSGPHDARTFGVQPYSGAEPTTAPGPSGEDVVATNLPCSIQAKSGGKNNAGSGLPADSPGPVHWRIFMPRTALRNGVIRNQDIVVDDLGARYMVDANYWNSLGYALDTIRLET